MKTQPIQNLSAPSLKKEVKIFVIDDDPMYRQVLEHKFRDQSEYKVHSFKTGEECFRHLNLIDPDIIILDYSLNRAVPNAMNGIEILKRLKNIKPQTPVLMLSGKESITIATSCIKYGAADYLVKGENTFLKIQHTIKRTLQKIKLQQKIKEEEKLGKLIVVLVILTVIISSGVSLFLVDITPFLIITIFSLFLIFYSVLYQHKFAKRV